MTENPRIRLEIEELGFSRVARGGWPRLRAVAMTAIRYGVGFGAFAAILIGFGRGWNQVPQNSGVILFFAGLGVLLGIAKHLLTDQLVVLGEDDIAVKEEGRRSRVVSYKEHPRSTVKDLSIRCWQKKSLLSRDIRWHADLTVHWVDEQEPPLDIRGTAIGVERSAERLDAIYPVVERNIPSPMPGTSAKERVKQERAEIAKLREMGLGRACWRYGVLPSTAATMVTVPPLMGWWLDSWRSALAGLCLSLVVGPICGCIGGFAGWYMLLDRESEILDQEWPREFSQSQ